MYPFNRCCWNWCGCGWYYTYPNNPTRPINTDSIRDNDQSNIGANRIGTQVNIRIGEINIDTDVDVDSEVDVDVDVDVDVED